VGSLTDDTANNAKFAVDYDNAVTAFFLFGERPIETVFAVIERYRRLEQESMRLLRPRPPIRVAEIGVCEYWAGIHFDLLTRLAWLEPVAALVTLGGFVI
jgi:hypothetical protein